MGKAEEYGRCDVCGANLEPVWFEEEETKFADGCMYHTGRRRIACSHLTCPLCLKNFVVDDSFDGDWYSGGMKR